jgi:hypothetical protein
VLEHHRIRLGMKQRLGIAAASLGDPELLVLDVINERSLVYEGLADGVLGRVPPVIAVAHGIVFAELHTRRPSLESQPRRWREHGEGGAYRARQTPRRRGIHGSKLSAGTTARKRPLGRICAPSRGKRRIVFAVPVTRAVMAFLVGDRQRPSDPCSTLELRPSPVR